MKHLLLAFACLLVTSLSVRAQAPDTSTAEKLISYVLDNLDKTQVPSGFLQEKSMRVLDMPTFNGVLTDSNLVDMVKWRMLYFQLYNSYCGGGSNPLVSILTVNDSIKSHVNSV